MTTKRFLQKTIRLLFYIAIFFLLFLLFYILVTFVTSPINFEKSKITDTKLCVCLFDSENRPIEHTFLNGDYISLKQLPDYTKQCFISIEDKNFYRHHGVNYKRMVMAIVKNILSFSFKEGASTISQQLIKNTHLSSDKTIKRKINEIKLTFELERKMSKDEILEYYLNIIYFGDNCYGIQSASEHYFSHSASKLSLGESALLAGLIKSPNKYSPVKKYDLCLKRRNVVLYEMLKDGNIDKELYNNEKMLKTDINVNPYDNNRNSYATAVVDEAENILKLPEKQIALAGYKIHTYMDKNKQHALEDCLPNDISEDVAMISLNAKNGYVEAYAQKSTISLINIKRQPASAIKPVLVYAPALNENIISPSTILLDEKININGYSPDNIGGKNYGYVDATFALSQSLNIPAVKVLSYVGIDKAKYYLEKQNISFCSNDDNMAIALGGMTYGTTLKELTNTYQTLANSGNFIKSCFIKYIVNSNGKVIYKNEQISKNIFRDDTAYLISQMLNVSTKTGTAKRMSDLNYFVASKTGTSSCSNENLDAYNISYTSSDVVGCWIGNIDNTPTEIVGGGKPTVCVKNYFNQIYKNKTPDDFNMPSSVTEVEIDELGLINKHTVYKANNFLPERFRKKALFSRFNMPSEAPIDDMRMCETELLGKVKNGVIELEFCANEYYIYDIFVKKNGVEEIIDKVKYKNGKTTLAYSINNYKDSQFYIKCKLKNYTTGEEYLLFESNIVSFET